MNSIFNKLSKALLFAIASLTFQTSTAVADGRNTIPRVTPPRHHEIRLLNGGVESFAAHLVAIRNAKDSIDILSYELDPCDISSRYLLNAMAERADVGVKVRMVIDSYNLSDQDFARIAGFFAAHNMKLKLYNSRSMLLGKSLRNHIKLFLIDARTKDAVYFSDSRNLTDQYFGFAKDLNFAGRDLMVVENTAPEAIIGFEKIFNRAGMTQWVKGTPTPLTLDQMCPNTIDDFVKEVHMKVFVNKPFEEIVSAMPVYVCRDVKYYIDDPRFFISTSATNLPDENGRKIFMTPERLKYKQASAATLDFINGAKTTLIMENQYYLPETQISAAIREASQKRGVNTLIFTNRKALADAGVGDVMTKLMFKAVRQSQNQPISILPISGLGALSAEGEDFKRTDTKWYIHSKTAVRDHKDVIVGSFNLDGRSFGHNLEALTVVRDCPELARALTDQYVIMADRYDSDQLNCKACAQEAPPTGVFLSIFGALAYGFL